MNFGSLLTMKTMTGNDIGFAAELLRKGELVAIPTETVYGLAGNAQNDEAVIKIYEVKQRPRFNPLIIHLPTFEKAGKYVSEMPADALLLAEKFSPGPISFLLNKSSLVSDLVTAGSDKVVIRIPSHPMALELLQILDFPLAAPSANPFGYISPVKASQVMDGLGGKIPYILDGGNCSVGLESTIVGFENGEITIHRPGGITAEDIRKITGKDPKLFLSRNDPQTPGQLKSHYAPFTPMLVGDVKILLHANKDKRSAVISFRRFYPGASFNFVLSPSGNLHEAASHLFTALREIDQMNLDLILAEKFPDEGIGMAINDRLARAGAGAGVES
jgi:L-threonylcarbamoyladenylate synthase